MHNITSQTPVPHLCAELSVADALCQLTQNLSKTLQEMGGGTHHTTEKPHSLLCAQGLLANHVFLMCFSLQLNPKAADE